MIDARAFETALDAHIEWLTENRPQNYPVAPERQAEHSEKCRRCNDGWCFLRDNLANLGVGIEECARIVDLLQLAASGDAAAFVAAPGVIRQIRTRVAAASAVGGAPQRRADLPALADGRDGGRCPIEVGSPHELLTVYGREKRVGPKARLVLEEMARLFPKREPWDSIAPLTDVKVIKLLRKKDDDFRRAVLPSGSSHEGWGLRPWTGNRS